jgi:quinoprotein glucose dehydrogenase
LVAVNLVSGEIEWEIPFGEISREVPESENWGSPSFGGPMITAGGLIFIAAAMDDFIRAFDIETGEEVWKASLPAGGQATPMTYEVAGKQYIVIAAGGHGNLGTTLGDYVVAFALR